MNNFIANLHLMKEERCAIFRYDIECLCCTIHSVQFNYSVLYDSLQPYRLQHAMPPCPSPAPGGCSNWFPSSRWCHLIISSSVVPFSFFQYFPASGSFSTNQYFSSGGQIIGVSVSASVPPMNIHDWFPSGCTSWIFLQSKRVSRVFSNTTVKNHQFFCT